MRLQLNNCDFVHMKILHILPTIESSSGGPPRSTTATLRALHEADASVENTVLSTDFELRDEWRATLEDRFPERTTLKLFPLIGEHTLSFSPKLVRWLWRHIRQFDVVVIRAMLHPLSSACAWIARWMKVPYVITPHGTLSRYTFEHRNTWLKRNYYRLVESKTLEGASCIQATTPQEREQVKELGTDTPIRVIPHPFEGGTRQNEVQRDPKQVLFLSRLHPMKGLDLLMEAASRVREDHPEVHFVIAGSGSEEYEAELRQRSQELQIQDRVEFVGFVEGEEKQRLFASCGAFVLPSYRENFGIAAIEAMDAGMPVVVSDCVETYTDIVEYDAGIVIKPDASELVEALERLLSTPQLRDRLGKRGKSLVAEKYSPQRVGRKLRDMYKDSVNGNPASS